MVLARLRKLGYEPDAVNDGAEAVEAVRPNDYNLVLMGCQMPTMEGFEATKLIRPVLADASRPRVPIIALTAGAMKEDRDHCLAEMDGYLSRPLDMNHLHEVTTRFCRDKQPITESRADDDRKYKTDVFNERELLERLSGHCQMAGSVLRSFLEHDPAQIHSLRTELDRVSFEGVLAQAHSLKGSAAMVSALSLHALALAVGTAGEAGEPDRWVRGLISRFKH